MSVVDDEMKKIVICKHCDKPEYFGEMRWLNGRQECRSCYKSHYEEISKKLYTWNDLDGPRPTWADYAKQEGPE